MRKIAIIAPCILPVPATKGGAVEELVTSIIKQNELTHDSAIDLYTIADVSYNEINFSYTNIIPISTSFIQAALDGITDKIYRHIPKGISAKRLLDNEIINVFRNKLKQNSEEYYAVIIENQMSTACELIKALGDDIDFPIYFHMHNDVDMYRSPEQIRFLTSAGVQFICVSNYIASQVLKYARKAVCHTLYNGVDFDAYSKTTKQQAKTVKFLYAGRIIPTKGVLELVEAFGSLLDKPDLLNATPITLDIVGFSGLDARYEEKIKKEAIKHPTHIQCIGQVSTTAMAELYNEYDVVVMPTINEEPFGLVALETMAKGIPLITTNSGALPEVTEGGALIVDKNRDFVSNLATAIAKLAVDSDYRITLGTNAYNLARKNVDFDINSYYHRLVGIVWPKDHAGINDEMISVIVPVYNVKDYLDRCVASLINQTYSNIEIILVDDGSTDESKDMCDKYATIDTRIKVIHQSNAGLSGARNTGLDNASGEYIYFVDSDDYLELNALELMINRSHRFNADVVACGIKNVFDNSELDYRFTSKDPGTWSGKESVIQMMRTNNVCTVAWNKLYKANLWKDLRFTVGVLHEDEDVTYKPLYMANIVTFMPDCLYDYYQRGDSIVHLKQEVRYEDFFNAIEKRMLFFEEKNEKELIEHSLLTFLEHLKYVYRETGEETRSILSPLYNQMIAKRGLPGCAGIKKKLALWLWKYYKY